MSDKVDISLTVGIFFWVLLFWNFDQNEYDLYDLAYLSLLQGVELEK